MFGKLNQRWHNVPEGTALEIVATDIVFGDVVHTCRRLDGEKMPAPYGPLQTVRIVATFINIDE